MRGDIISWFSLQCEVFPFVVQKYYGVFCVLSSQLKHLFFQCLKCKYIQTDLRSNKHYKILLLCFPCLKYSLPQYEISTSDVKRSSWYREWGERSPGNISFVALLMMTVNRKRLFQLKQEYCNIVGKLDFGLAKR